MTESGWTFYPIITADSELIGFFAQLPDELSDDSNVSLVWTTPDQGDGTWNIYGWQDADFEAVSAYIDELAGSQGVLFDTGVDFPAPATDTTVESATPVSMPQGIIESDPAAILVWATSDPDLAEALISNGAAGAPTIANAKNSQPVGSCGVPRSGENDPITNFDVKMTRFARIAQESINVWLSDSIAESMQITGYDQDNENIRWFCCPYTSAILWGPWTRWSCVTGPVANAGGSCAFTGCTRSRVGTQVRVAWNCTTTTITIPNSQGPVPKTVPRLPSGNCPSNP